MSFTKVKEDFTCGHCGFKVTGTGYTNHCPSCLWSRHVDIDPGDRASLCGELMKPIRYDLEHGEFILVHQCVRCGHQKRNKLSKDDNIDTLARLTKPIA